MRERSVTISRSGRRTRTSRGIGGTAKKNVA
jgi:hypothetical protein